MRVLTVAVPGMLPQARVLADSLRRHEPDWPLEVALLGAAPQAADDGLTLISIDEELGLDTRTLLARHELGELLKLLVPRLLEKRCRDAAEPMLHLPPSVWVLDSLEPLETQVRRAGVLLATRLSGDLPDDGLEPTRAELARAGRIAPELIAVDGSPGSRSFLRWWIERSENVLGRLDEPPVRRAEDWPWLLRMLELAPIRFSVALLEDPGCNVSVWNLHERPAEEAPTGVRIDGWPLRFMDLPGFEPDHPYRLSEMSSRVRLSRMPALRALVEQYARELVGAGWHNAGHVSLGGRLANGLVFDEAMLHLHATACALGEDFGDLFSTEGTEAFMLWLRQPASPAHGINRYVVQRVIRERTDVTAAFPDLNGADADQFAAWWRDAGSKEIDVPGELSATPMSVNGQAQAADRSGAVPLPSPVEATAPPAKPSPAATPPATAADGTALGVRVTGYLSHVLGLGSAARGYASALAAAGVPVSTVSVPLDHLQAPVELSSEYGRHSFDDVVHEGGHGFELVCVNPDELPHVVSRLGAEFFEGPRIGVWGWETNRIPERWKGAFTLVDEIWVYSEFMAANIGAVAPVPVIALPPPVEAPSRNRGELTLGVPRGFMFLFIFDYLSTIQRKNPVGVIEAFKRAFAPGEGPRLLIKTLNAPLRPYAEEEVLWAAEGRLDIHVLDRSLSADEKDALMSACDCYVSLHRSEGFGLTLAEAMAIGKPVIGTGYSGNVTFMTPENSFLVPYRLTKVGPGVEIYPADGDWAEPDIDEAAKLIRHVYEDPQHAASIGARARADIARTLAPAATGAAMRKRLEELSVARSVGQRAATGSVTGRGRG